MVCEVLPKEVLVSYLLSYPLTYLLFLPKNVSLLALLVMVIKLENWKGNLIMLFLECFQHIQVIPFEPS